MIKSALAATALACTALAATPALAQDHVMRHPQTPPAMILGGVTVNPGATLLYLSGQLASPIDPAKAHLPPEQMAKLTTADYGDTRTQTVSALNKIKGLLAANGFAMSDVIKMTVFVAADPAMSGGKMDFAGMNAGFKQFFGTADNPNTVARSAFQVAALAAPWGLVEIEVIAAK